MQTEYIQIETIIHFFKAIFGTRNKDKWQKNMTLCVIQLGFKAQNQ